MTHPGNPQRLYPTQLTGPPKLLFNMNGWSWIMLHNLLNPIKQAEQASVSPRHDTSSRQLRFTAWLPLGSSKPSTSSSHLTLLYSSGRVPQGEIQVRADLRLHDPRYPRANAPSGQLHTLPKYHPSTSMIETLNDRLSRHQNPTEANLAPWGSAA